MAGAAPVGQGGSAGAPSAGASASGGGAGGSASGSASGGVAGTAASAGAGSGGAGGVSATGGSGGGDIGGGPMGTAGGTFVQCDDHADFNGRGRCAPTGKVGAVFAVENLTASSALTTLTATFGSTKPPSEAGCTEEAAGGCRVLTCPHPAPPLTPGPAAGAITVKSSGGSMTTHPDAQGNYEVVKLASPLWSPMAALAFSAAGGATPSFGENFCGPPGVTLSAPATVPSAALVVNRNADLALSWTGSNVGDVELMIRDDSNAASSIEVQCFFTAASGQGSVPAAALGKISPGAHTLASYTWVREIGIAAGGTCTELTGVMTNFGAGAKPFNGVATFQ